eukprot:8779183-Alexandrium_andersonii.AAC.1
MGRRPKMVPPEALHAQTTVTDAGSIPFGGAHGGAWVSAGTIRHGLRACEVGVRRHSSRRERRHSRCMNVLAPSTSRTHIISAEARESTDARQS